MARRGASGVSTARRALVPLSLSANLWRCIRLSPASWRRTRAPRRIAQRPPRVPTPPPAAVSSAPRPTAPSSPPPCEGPCPAEEEAAERGSQGLMRQGMRERFGYVGSPILSIKPHVVVRTLRLRSPPAPTRWPLSEPVLGRLPLPVLLRSPPAPGAHSPPSYVYPAPTPPATADGRREPSVLALCATRLRRTCTRHPPLPQLQSVDANHQCSLSVPLSGSTHDSIALSVSLYCESLHPSARTTTQLKPSQPPSSSPSSAMWRGSETVDNAPVAAREPPAPAEPLRRSAAECR